MEQTNKNLPRDVFLYLLALVSLIASAVGFGVILFQIINVYFPDVLNDFGSRSVYYLDQLRYFIALAVVMFPVLIFTTRFLRRDILRNPEKSELKIRKWLIYLTLFVAGLVMIGDAVSLINSFLKGEITVRFILKIISVFFIAGSIFYYYLSDLKKSSSKIASWVIIAVVIAGVVFGFYVAGSPNNQRLARLDDIRVNDLQNIQSQVINYWQSMNKLPNSSADLKLLSSGSPLAADPVSGKEYEYRVVDAKNLKFELCADFQTAGINNQSDIKTMPAPFGVINESDWQHDKGHYCFSRTINPLSAKPLK